MGGIGDPREILFKNVYEEGPWALGEIGEMGEISFNNAYDEAPWV